MENAYSVIRSKRKTLSIQITRAGEIVVRAPMRVPQAQISGFVKKHEAWIAKHLESVNSELEAKRSFTFADGQCVYFFGNALFIRTNHYINDVQIIENCLQISGGIPDSSREQAVIQFLSNQALTYLQKMADAFAPRMGISPQSLAVTKAKTRWGSCSGKNRVCFSFRLICLPPELIDYVVVHELAHILEHNHSPRFYAQIARILPDYKRRQDELKAFQRRLTL